jgi:hypothetical protein
MRDVFQIGRGRALVVLASHLRLRNDAEQAVNELTLSNRIAFRLDWNMPLAGSLHSFLLSAVSLPMII